MPNPTTSATSDKAVAELTRRLVSRFSQIPSDLIEATVRSAARRLGDARITAFVPVLVEHAALEELRKLAATDGARLPRVSGEPQ